MTTKVVHAMTEGIYSEVEVDLMFQYGVELQGELAPPYVPPTPPPAEGDSDDTD